MVWQSSDATPSLPCTLKSNLEKVKETRATVKVKKYDVLGLNTDYM